MTLAYDTDTFHNSIMTPILVKQTSTDEFLYPQEYLADQRLYYQYALEVERRAALDPPSLRDANRRRK